MAALFLFIWLFNFIRYMPATIFLSRISTADGRKHLIATIFSYGFGKSSFRIFLRAVYILFNRPEVALIGKVAPDCALVDLNGIQTSMREFILRSTSLPLVVIMGSYS